MFSGEVGVDDCEEMMRDSQLTAEGDEMTMLRRRRSLPTAVAHGTAAGLLWGIRGPAEHNGENQ